MPLEQNAQPGTCPKCGAFVPHFDLSSTDYSRLIGLIDQNRQMMAMHELRTVTGCSLQDAKSWVIHRGRPEAVGTTAPCPYCGKPLVTARAKQCQHCYMDWHDPKKPKNLKLNPWVPRGD